VHRLVEDEFFDLETFTSRSELLAKAQTYQLYFNLARPNSDKQFQTPGQIIEDLAPPRLWNFACFHPPFWLITSMTRGDTMCQAIPGGAKILRGGLESQNTQRILCALCVQERGF
jgi:hypothetical protein